MEQEKDARFVADEQPAIQLRATCNYNSHGLTEAPSDFASARHASDSEHAREGRKERKMGNRTTGQGAQPVRVGSIGRDATQVRGRPPTWPLLPRQSTMPLPVAAAGCRTQTGRDSGPTYYVRTTGERASQRSLPNSTLPSSPEEPPSTRLCLGAGTAPLRLISPLASPNSRWLHVPWSLPQPGNIKNDDTIEFTRDGCGSFCYRSL
jgi:hypothetical protein